MEGYLLGVEAKQAVPRDDDMKTWTIFDSEY
jgi:hypothetical protein